jgi:hypothetical protein
MKTYARAVVLVVVGAVIAVVADPVHRATTFRVALLAIGALVAAALLQRAARLTPKGDASPFDRVRPARPEAVVPADLQRLFGDLDRYRHAERGRLASGTLDRTVRDVARQRLAHHHGIVVGDELLSDEAARALLGPETRAVLGRRGAGPAEPVDPDRLAEELERLGQR